MDFDLTDDQKSFSNLAEAIFSDLATSTRVSEIEESSEKFDLKLWNMLGEAGLLGTILPEAYGGLGLGMVELSLLLEQQGRTVAQVPLLANSVLGSWALASYGTDKQKNLWLEGVCQGKRILTGAWNEQNSQAEFAKVVAKPDGNKWRITGERIAVPAVGVSEAVLTPVEIDGNQKIAVVPLDAKGIHTTIVETTSRELQANLFFDSVEISEEQILMGSGTQITNEVLQRAKIGICALVLGCCEEALTMTAHHVSEREQFGRPLSTNQGVALQAADAHIATDGIRITQMQSAWQLDAGIDCEKSISAAKYWASEAGQRVVITTQHLHGGTGADISHPIHRYFLWVINLADTLGGVGSSLSQLGKSIATEAHKLEG